MRPVDDSGSPNHPPDRPDQGTPDGSSRVAAEEPPSPAVEGLAGAGGYASRPPRPPREPTASGSTSSGSTLAGVGTGRHRLGDESQGDGEEIVDRRDPSGPRPGASKRRGSFWRELPLLILVALVLTFVIQTFVGRVYVIPSGSMERTLYGGVGGNVPDDRVAVDKMVYRLADPGPGEVVVFKGPPDWVSNDEVSDDRSDNALVRGLQQAASLIGFSYGEKDFVKRVIAVGGQTVACCDTQNRVSVDGRPLVEPYLYYQPGFGTTQKPFGPVTVPPGQLWVMGDNRNNSLDARAHGPVPLDDVIGKVRLIVLPVNHWGVVHAVDPQARTTALGGSGPPPGLPLAAGLVFAVPATRRSRARSASGHAVATAPPVPGRGVATGAGSGTDPSRAGS